MRPLRSSLAAVARHPWTHFALLGAVLWVAAAPWRAGDDATPGTAADEPIVVTAADLRRLAHDFEQRWGFAPTAEQQRSLVAQYVDEEILVRQARALALDHGDASVRRRLLEKARAVGLAPAAGEEALLAEVRALGLDDDVVVRRILAQKMRLVLEGAPPPGWDDDTALQETLERHRERWLQPETISFSHVFVASDRPGLAAAEAAEAAEVARRELRSEPPDESARALSDPFPLGLRVSGYTREKLVGRFGEPFARAVLELEPGRWSPPLRSPYGLHLVWVEERQPARLPPLEAVREPVRSVLRAEHAARSLGEGMARLRAFHDVRVEDEDPRLVNGGTSADAPRS